MNELMNFGATAVTIATSTIATSWLWYVIRASGIVALSLLILLMFSGIGQVTGWTYKLMSPVRAWSVHKAMAIMLAISIAVHVLSILFDTYIPFSLVQVLVPFTNFYSNHSSIFGIGLAAVGVAAGIVAGYGAYAVVFSSLDTTGWIRNHKKLWKSVHVISYGVMFLAIIHALGTGTDFKYGVTRDALIAFGFVLLLGALARLRRRTPKPTPES